MIALVHYHLREAHVCESLSSSIPALWPVSIPCKLNTYIWLPATVDALQVPGKLVLNLIPLRLEHRITCLTRNADNTDAAIMAERRMVCTDHQLLNVICHVLR